MRGEWAQLKGKMANPTELGASQEGYVTEKPLRNVASQRTNLEEALIADREAARSRGPAVKPWVTNPEAASTLSTDEEKGNEDFPPLRRPYGVRMSEEGEVQSEKAQEESGQADIRELHAKMVGHGCHRRCLCDTGHSFGMELLLVGKRGHESLQRCDVAPGEASDARALEPKQDARKTRQEPSEFLRESHL